MKFLIIAGEVSGDMHAARLVKAVKERLPDSEFFGIGGNEMRSAGVKLFQHTNDMAVMGFTEVVRRYGFFKRVLCQMAETARKEKPDAVILVDYPGFNLRLAARTHKLGIKTIYYICPQVWAWNQSRIPKMARIVDRLITIFPFEQKHFKDTDLTVDYVGHPLVDEAKKALNEPQADLDVEGNPLIALLPGSRPHEIKRLLPAMWSAALLLEKKHPDACFVIAAPSSEMANAAQDIIKNISAKPLRWKIITGKTRQVLRAARAALVASGTATIEAALMLCPMVIAYRMAILTYLFGRMLVKIDDIGMVNIVAGKKICPEFIQDAVTPEALANAIEPLLADTPERSEMIAALKKVSHALGPGGAESKAAEIIIEELTTEGTEARSGVLRKFAPPIFRRRKFPQRL
ncbi:lipid-A-disaccharide synthase [Verrucomicrobiota bacterium]